MNEEASQFLMERFEAINQFEDYFGKKSPIASFTARAWYRRGSYDRFFDYSDGDKMLLQCQIVEKAVPLDDIFWRKGTGSFE